MFVGMIMMSCMENLLELLEYPLAICQHMRMQRYIRIAVYMSRLLIGEAPVCWNLLICP